MNRNIYSILVVILIEIISLSYIQLYGQAVWTQKANVGLAGRYGAVAFSIGNKGYILGGSIGPTDFWEWDQATNNWSLKASFPGVARGRLVGFSIDTMGYIVTGQDISGAFTNEFWEWNQTTNVWTKKANFGGPGRINAVGFSIGKKGYVGTGTNSHSTTGSTINDFWEWDQSTDTWAKKADFGGTARREAVGFSIGTKGYIGTGTNNGNGTSRLKDFWEWDQASNLWTKKTDFGGSARAYAIGMSDGFRGYIGFGGNGSATSDFWMWDPNTDQWFQKPGLSPSLARYQAVGFCIGIKAYMGTGVETTTYYKDFWELDLCDIKLDPIPLPICAGQDIVMCVSGATAYSWSSGQTTRCVSAAPTSTTTYFLNASLYGTSCSLTDTIIVPVSCTGVSLCQNRDFEQGNFKGWTGLSGRHVADSIVWTGGGGLNFKGNDILASSSAQHTIISTSSLDPFTIETATGLPDPLMTTLAPSGGNYSIRLGNTKTGYGAEALRITYIPTLTDSIFTYQFACVFQNPGHTTTHEPGFMVNIYDSTLNIISSLSDTIYSPDPKVSLIAVSSSAPDPTVLYKRWAHVNKNLAAYIGHTLLIEFANFDCGDGAHWGYTYLDGSCFTLTNIESFEDADILSIYPNPCNGEFLLLAPNSSYVTIVDGLGREVYSKKMNLNSEKVNLQNEANGIYFVKVFTNNKQQVKLITINK